MKQTSTQLIPHTWTLAVVWVVMGTIIMAISLAWNLTRQKDETIQLATIEAQTVYEKDIIYHKWATAHNGVFVPITKKTQPNPYLAHVPGANITTSNGQKLTLINPEYMIRQVYGMQTRDFGPIEHITSLDPKRPGNAADAWETSALELFDQGKTKAVSVATIDGKPYLRYMRPMTTEQGCLKCHAVQGYKVGDIRGGISVSIPLDPLMAIAKSHNIATWTAHIIFWALGLTGLLLGTYWLTLTMREREKIEARTRSIIDNMLDGLITLNQDNIIQSFNPAATRLFDYTPEEVIGKSIYTLFRLPEQYDQKLGEEHEDEDFILITNNPYELIGCHKNGSTFPVEISVSETLSEGDHLSIAMVRDLSRRKKAELALRDSQEHLIKQEKLASLGTMVAGIAHEINNPAQAIGFSMEGLKMNVEYIKDILNELTKCSTTDREALIEHRDHLFRSLEELDIDLILEDIDDVADRNIESVARINKIIKSTKRMAHFEDDFTSCDLNTIIFDALTLTHSQIKYDMEVQMFTGTDLPEFQGMSQELGQVFINLIINARDAIREKGLSKKTGLLKISTRFHAARQQLEARFEDNGIGIKDDVISKVFDPFFTTKDLGIGTGLGLNLSHLIVEAHGGQITIESNYGEGACFTVILRTTLPDHHRNMKKG